MLINQMGVESDDDDVTRLDDHRPTPDPKNRETMTGLLQVALAAVPRSQLLPRTPAPLADIVAVPREEPRDNDREATSHSDVA